LSFEFYESKENHLIVALEEERVVDVVDVVAVVVVVVVAHMMLEDFSALLWKQVLRLFSKKVRPFQKNAIF